MSPYSDGVNIELRHLRAFVAVAEELNFTRAAERLFIAQQALSSQIRQLEDRIGARLFDRDTRRVALTPAGQTLYQQALPLLASADAAVAAAREAAHPVRRLVVGFVAAIHHAFYADALDRFALEHPDTEMMIHFGDTTDPTGGLRTRQTDVAFLYGPFDAGGLNKIRLFDEPLGIVMARDHPLAELDPLPLSAVLDQPTFDFTTDDQAWHDYWMATAFRSGRPPRIVARFRTLDALVEALRRRLGVHTGTRSLAELGGPDLIWREMEQLPRLQHYVAWHEGSSGPEVVDFVRTVEAMFGLEPEESKR